MNKYIERVMKDVQAKNANEPEFLQAVDEVLTTLTPVIDANKSYEANAILERMVEPERVVICDALKSSKGKIAAAARSLSTTPRILTYKINQLGIDLAGFGK